MYHHLNIQTVLEIDGGGGGGGGGVDGAAIWACCIKYKTWVIVLLLWVLWGC